MILPFDYYLITSLYHEKKIHTYINSLLVGGLNPSEKYEFVSWDHDIPDWMESHKIHVPNHQPNISIPGTID